MKKQQGCQHTEVSISLDTVPLQSLVLGVTTFALHVESRPVPRPAARLPVVFPFNPINIVDCDYHDYCDV
jgi:hypothetical protein